jgi:acetyl-CoA decarbonylase/synthase complex subunit gamma
MRKVTFIALERLVLAPLEFIMGLKKVLLIIILFVLASGINGFGYSFERLSFEGWVAFAIIFSAFVAGVFLSALLLPYLPGRSFSFRGAYLGFVFVAFPSFLGMSHSAFNGSYWNFLTWWLLIPVIVSFLCQQFTGCSTFTSLSGVELELRFALPVQALAFCFSLVLWVAGHVLLPLAF